jgi:adenine deaminase
MNSIQAREKLVRVALGKDEPDLIIHGGSLLNVHTHEIYPADILILGERIAAVEEPAASYPDGRTLIHAEGKTIVPGFIDPHIHLESSAVTLSEYVRVALPRGVTTIAEDPHEMANVLGVEGFKLFFEEARGLPINLLLRVPGRVPGISAAIETSGAEISPEQTKELLDWEAAVCLAGDINPNLLLNQDPAQLEKIAYAMQLRKTISGQSPGLQGGELNAYIAVGPEDSHVSEDTAEVLDILRHGLRALITHRQDFFKVGDYPALARAIKARNLDTRLLCFCSDDVQPHFLLSEGSLDARIRLAIQNGIDPITAIQMATINTADFLRIDRDLGSITPGKIADIVILDNLETVQVDRVFFHGKLAAEQGKLAQKPPRFAYPGWAKNTMHLQQPVRAEDFQLRMDSDDREVQARVIRMGMPKQEMIRKLSVEGGIVLPDPERDILSVAVLDRHKKSGRIGRGFVTGIGIKNGAVASTVSHDAHNIFVVGADFEAMAAAVNQLAAIGGGHVAIIGTEVVAQVELPVAGLISEEPVKTVAAKFETFERVLSEQMGCPLAHPLYFINFLCLPNIPHLGITDQGLINTDTMQVIETIL